MNNEMARDASYFEWLCERVQITGYNRAYPGIVELSKVLHEREYIWLVPNDDNRYEDGRALRHYFRDEAWGYDYTKEWEVLNCSFFEFLVALVDRCVFIGGGEKLDGSDRYHWYLELLDNIGLLHLATSPTPRKNTITRRVKIVNHRQYSSTGEGGLFPMKHTKRDQRRVEVWSQLNEYIGEREE